MSIRTLLLVMFLCFWSIEFVCNGDSHIATCLESDRDALIAFRNGLEDPDSRLSSWKGEDCCQWKGVRCESSTGAVIAVDLHNQDGTNSEGSTRYESWNLGGYIDPALLRLKSLTHLDLSLNSFQGIPIPEFFGSFERLQYLNLSQTGFAGFIPENIGNISSLQDFDVSFVISQLRVHNLRWVGNLASLRYLGLNGVDLSLLGSNSLRVLNRLPFLNELHLSGCSLSGSILSVHPVNMTSLGVIDLSFNGFVSTFPDWIVNVSSLVSLDLSNSALHGDIPLDISDLPNLRYLNLAGNNNLSADCSKLLDGSWRRIEVLNLGTNSIYGRLTTSLGNMTTLIDLDLSNNNVEGEIPSSVGNLCRLRNLNLDNNKLIGDLPENLDRTMICVSVSPLPSLMYLSLSFNRLAGELPGWLTELPNLERLSLTSNLFHGAIPTSLGRLSLLSDLSLAGNELTGVLPDTLGQLSNLVTLDVSFNYLTGNVSEVHFSKLKKLKFLHLSSNSLVLNMSTNWVPPFQVGNLDLRSCVLGPAFPSWLKTQRDVMFLDCSNASLSGDIPTWFWELSPNLSLVNVSFNHLQGQLPNRLTVAPFADVDFSFNLLEGPIPLPASEVELLDLSHNQFTGPIPPEIGQVLPNLIFFSLSNNFINGPIPVSIGDILLLQVLDLSKNNLTAEIPSSLQNCSIIKVIDLGHNNLSGTIPSSFGKLNQLVTLRLSNNYLSGGLPSSLHNCSSLETLDLGNNEFQDNIPIWIGENLLGLKILRLRSNSFSGSIPFELTNLTSLQVLDLAENNLVGTIPDSLGGLKAMVNVHNVNHYIFHGFYRGAYYEESLVVNKKDQSLTYTKTLSLVTSIDLSGNNLHGELPQAITQLHGLVFLSLSSNRLTGHIPKDIAVLHELLSFDISSNQFSGAIPSIMASMSSLSYLNLSSNNFSGMIPFTGQLSTFDESSYSGNPRLCGTPLIIKCQGDNQNQGHILNDGRGHGDRDDTEFIDQWFYLSVGLGFATGILVPFALFTIRRPWSDAYFGFVDKIVRKPLRNNISISRRS